MAEPLTHRLSNISQPLLLGIGFALVIAIAVGSVFLVRRSSENSELIAHTLDVQNKLSTFLLDARRVESAQRGYLLTGQRVYLDDYRRIAGRSHQQLADLRTATADNPERQSQIDEAERLIGEKTAETDRTIELRESGDNAAALALVASGEGRNYMETLRAAVDAIGADEARLLKERNEASEATDSRLLLSTLIGAALVIMVGAASVLLVQRSSRQRAEAQRAVEDTNANLERTVAERTTDLREANDEIQRFAYIVSHDLRSPLVNIMGFTSELEALHKDAFERLNALRGVAQQAEEDAALGRDLDEALSFIKVSITKMDRLINAILRLSREGGREFKPEAIDMDQMIGTIAAGVAHQLSDAGAEIAVESLPFLVSDRLALEQIFSNLIDNAVKYSRADVPGRIKVRGRASPAFITYEIEDNGRGIEAKDHQRVYDLFRRAGPQDRPGEGIGLAHVRALVRRLGGTMGLKSEFGHGSIFSVTLPRRWTSEAERNAA